MHTFNGFYITNGQQIGQPPASISEDGRDWCESRLFLFEMQDAIYSPQDRDDMARLKILLALPVEKANG